MASTTNNNQNNTTESYESPSESKDEVDFVVVANNNNYGGNIKKANNLHNNNNNCSEIVPKSSILKQQMPTPVPAQSSQAQNQTQSQSQHVPNAKLSTQSKKKTDSNADQKKSTTTKERLSLFAFGKRLSQKVNAEKAPKAGEPAPPSAADGLPKLTPPSTLPCTPPPVPIGTPPRQHKFVKSSSIARLLNSSNNAKKCEKMEQKRLANETKFHTYGGPRRCSGPYMERFKRASREDSVLATSDCAGMNGGSITLTTDSRDLYGGSRSELASLTPTEHNADLGVKALRTISRGLGKLWWRRSHSVDISTPDPEFKVSYLGNVLTGWAKGEGCVEKQLNTLWRNYTQNNKPDVIMRLKVCASGLKATTRQHGLTEYWANRITHCCAPKNYPRVFCWIYRHEGRKLKHELRCHAVLCSKEKFVQDICNTLKENLECALREFKREKILKQNARLSLANAAYDNPSLPRRKILLSVGGNNYRPPLERSKSAPKLMAIEEAIGEEEGDEVEETNEPEMRACCQKDSLYPAMTLGRRRCRRGHSIRRTGKTRPNFGCSVDRADNDDSLCCSLGSCQDTKETPAKTEACGGVKDCYGSDDSDDFEKLLKYNDYDTSATLSNELLPYFDMQLHKKTSSSLGSLSELKCDDEDEPLSLLPTINSDPRAIPEADEAHDLHDLHEEPVMMGLRRSGVCSDGEEDYLDAEDMYFHQASLLNMLHRNSMRKMANLNLSSDESSSIETNASLSPYRHQVQSSISSNASSTATSNASTNGKSSSSSAQEGKQLNPDSDEGSISSGCETASTVTANQDDISYKYRHSKQMLHAALEEGMLHELYDEEPITAEEIYQRLESRMQKRHNSDATTFSSSSSITLKLGGPSPTTSVCELDGSTGTSVNANPRNRRLRRQASASALSNSGKDSDSECSDESGYVEYQEKVKSTKPALSNGGQVAAMQQQLLQQQQQQSKPQLPPKPMPRRLMVNKVKTTTAV